MKLWIARDSYGLWLFENKPVKCITNGDKYFSKQNNIRYLIDSSLFPEVTFENSPQKVELILCNRRIDTINIQDCNPKKQPCLLTNHRIETNVLFK